MLDEEKARREESSQFTSEEKIRILDRQVAALNTRFMLFIYKSEY